MEEIWKDVKGFESLYMVSNLGRVKNVPHFNTIMFGKIDQLKVQKRLMQILKIEGKYINIQKMEHSLKNMNL